MKKIMMIGVFTFLIAGLANAEILSFQTVWNKIDNDSVAQEASRLQTEALSESHSRVSRHWLPRLYIDAKSYQTNDPGAAFFGLLGQRSVQQSDFNPDLMNHPETQTYTRGALGIDLPLHEGGMKSAQVDVFKHAVAAQKNQTSQIRLDQYSQVSLAYGAIAILQEQKNRLQILNSEISRMIKGYQLGNKSNPVGYSGLLGMKSLANRIAGLINQYDGESQAYIQMLNAMGLQNQTWTPEVFTDANAFVDKYLNVSASKTDLVSSYKSDSTKEQVKASIQEAKMMNAKFLPRVGAFAESFIFSGKRDTANGYTAGVYLQWNLFDPADYGSATEAKLKALAAQKSSEASDQAERAERAALSASIKSLKENIALLNDSNKLLNEQSKMTATLFRNGSINALQIVEVLSRRADLISQHGEAELGLIKAAAQSITKEKFEITLGSNHGVKNER